MCRQVLKSKAKTDVICSKSQKANKLQSHWTMHVSESEGKFSGHLLFLLNNILSLMAALSL